MKLTEKRLSELSDMLITHILFRRTVKAILIGQFLRRYFGTHYTKDLDCYTGYRVKNRHPLHGNLELEVTEQTTVEEVNELFKTWK